MLAFAQDAAGPTLTVREDSEWGPYVADSEGLSLYSYLEDEGGESACTDEDCVRNWPPYTVSGEVAGEEGIPAELIGTFERPDGSLQVTYNGWPLYYNARDESAGDIRGQALGDVFFLMSPEGNKVDARLSDVAAAAEEEAEGEQGQEQAEEGEGDAAEADGEEAGEQPEGEQPEGEQPEGEGEAGAEGADMEALMTQGQGLFSSICQSCHGAEGQGLVGPALNGNRYLERVEGVINTILDGRPDHGMPSFANQFDDQEVAAVATYIRNAWENEFGPVTPEEVAGLR